MRRAERDLAAIFVRIEAADSKAGFRWYQELKAAIRTLSNNPRRCPLIPEKRDLRTFFKGTNPTSTVLSIASAKSRELLMSSTSATGPWTDSLERNCSRALAGTADGDYFA